MRALNRGAESVYPAGSRDREEVLGLAEVRDQRYLLRAGAGGGVERRRRDRLWYREACKLGEAGGRKQEAKKNEQRDSRKTYGLGRAYCPCHRRSAN